MAGRRHDGLVIVDRQRVEDDLGGGGAAGAQERLGVAGAVLELEPDEHRLLGLLMARAICAAAASGSASADAMAAQNPRNSRRDTPRRSSSAASHPRCFLKGHLHPLGVSGLLVPSSALS